MTKLPHEGTMHVSCEKGYETECKKNYDIYTCVGDKGSPKNKMVLRECTSKSFFGFAAISMNLSGSWWVRRWSFSFVKDLIKTY